MKIQDQTVFMSAQRQFEQTHSLQTMLLNRGRAVNNLLNSADGRNAANGNELNKQLNPESQLKTGQSQQAVSSTPATDNEPQLPEYLIRMIEVIESMMEKITGKPYHLEVYGYRPADSDRNAQTNNFMDNPSFNRRARLKVETTQQQTQQFILQQQFYEKEMMQFNAQGQISTEDGRQIDFDFKSQMFREFSAEQNLVVQSSQFKDPLVVNFGGQPASLTVDKFDFDIDADGNEDSLSFVDSGSGFLVYDKNQDAIINNGTELFGALSGNGFADLAQLDSDQNGWIDENDSIFSQLKVWHKDAQGFDHLSGLLELNIGAISLQHVASEFSLNDEVNQTHGQIRQSGIYLAETGQIGSVQQIDLVV